MGRSRRRAGRPADRHLRQPARRGPAGDHRRRRGGGEGERQSPSTGWCRTAARRSAPRSPPPDPAGRCWWPARVTSGSRSSAAASCRSPTRGDRAGPGGALWLRCRVGEAAAAVGGRVIAGDPRALLRRRRHRLAGGRGGELFFAFAGAAGRRPPLRRATPSGAAPRRDGARTGRRRRAARRPAR